VGEVSKAFHRADATDRGEQRLLAGWLGMFPTAWSSVYCLPDPVLPGSVHRAAKPSEDSSHAENMR
jgi:hypothetical protein